jgi:TetR/AcrR family transcriptional regulator, regulator of mycofactocin system
MPTQAVRRGRPPSTSPRELEVIALRLFTENGFDETTVEQIAAEAQVSSRTFFRYFTTKADVLWHAFDAEVLALRSALGAIPQSMPVLDGVRQAVVSVNRYTAADVPELRSRINLISTVPTLQASAAVHYDAWERAIIDFAADRLGQSPTSLIPLAIGRATLAVCRAAYELWVGRADADLTLYLDEAIRALSSGFSTAAPRRRKPGRTTR